MRRAAALSPLIAAAPPLPGRLSRTTLVVLAAAVLAAHLAILGWLPVGSVEGHHLDLKTVHLVTRVVPATPPAPRPAPRPRPVVHSPQPPAPAAPMEVADPPIDAATLAAATASVGDSAAADAPAAAAGEAPAEPPAPPAAPAPVAAAPPPPPPIGLPNSVRLRYNMNGESKGLVYHARAELLWQQDGAHYRARMEVSAFLLGSRVQTSEGNIGPAGLEPDRFADIGRKSEQATHFDRAAQRIVFSANTPEVALPPGAQDRLGIFMQLSSQLAGDPSRYPPGTAIAIPTAGPRDLGDWTFVVGPTENVQLPNGAESAIKLERAPRKEYDTRVEVWYAPALGYLPVRMRITQQNGDFIDQTLDSAEKP